MNVFKGSIVQWSGEYMGSFFEPLFKNYLLSIHRPELESIADKKEDTKPEEDHKRLINEQSRDKNFNLLKKYLLGYEYQNNVSFKDYLIKVYKSIKDEAGSKKLVDDIKSKLEELINNETNNSLLINLTGLAGLVQSMELSAKITGLELKSINFIEELDENGCSATSIRYDNKNNFSLISIYSTIHDNKSGLIKEELDDKLLAELNKSLPNIQLLDNKCDYFDKIESIINNYYNKVIINNQQYEPSVVLNFSINEKSFNFNGSLELEELLLFQIINNLTLIEKGLYNKDIKPLLVTTHLKQGSNDLLLIKKQEKGLIYLLIEGTNNISRVYCQAEKHLS